MNPTFRRFLHFAFHTTRAFPHSRSLRHTFGGIQHHSDDLRVFTLYIRVTCSPSPMIYYVIGHHASKHFQTLSVIRTFRCCQALQNHHKPSQIQVHIPSQPPKPQECRIALASARRMHTGKFPINSAAFVRIFGV